MASTHTRKKPYQSTKITTFFTPSSSAPSPGTSTPTVRPPPPPAQVQSSLLNVGMRIRKSVPEGYKTKSPTSSQPVTPAYTELPPPSQQSYFGNSGAYIPPSSAPPALPSGSSRDRELQPFCGLHSVGSFSSQHSQPSVPALTSSFSTVDSDGRKRRLDEEEDYEDEMEREMDAIFSTQEERPIAPLKGGRRGLRVQQQQVPGDFEDEDVRFLVMDVDA